MYVVFRNEGLGFRDLGLGSGFMRFRVWGWDVGSQ